MKGGGGGSKVSSISTGTAFDRSKALMVEDLGASGLEMQDMNCRPAGAPELQICNASGRLGYVIPYFDAYGEPLPFYRLKLFGEGPKYKQPKTTPNHVYFPKDFCKVLYKTQEDNEKPFVIVTEGEKKAAACTKMGVPSVAFGGVDNWRNRTIYLPEETEIESSKAGVLRAKLPGSHNPTEDYSLAVGFSELLDLLRECNSTVQLIICYDTDGGRIKSGVQRAAALLGYELRFQGLRLADIRQLILPGSPNTKVGLDDYIQSAGIEALVELIDKTQKKRTTFPRHPQPKEFVNKQLQRARLSRKESQNVSLAVLCELDARGRRLKEVGSSEPYFFDGQKKHLIPVQMLRKSGEPYHELPFGQFLYREFGLTMGDVRVLNWLASQFTGEDPVEEVRPLRVCSLHPKAPLNILHQINDHQYCIITPDKDKPFIVCDNGANQVLFEQGQVEPIQARELAREFEALNKMQQLPAFWADILHSSNIELSSENEHSVELFTLLCYCSPWLNRWRGTQLPIEIIIGEPGSGKSSLYELRLSILNGRPALRNMPHDLRDWYASITSAGGMHVTDNVNFTNKDLRQRLSDEICRLITEPEPHIELRKLYTTATQWRVPIRASFAMTGIEQPFPGVDLIQRAAILRVQVLESSFDGNWVANQLRKHGGRTRWLAHHLVALHRYLHAVVHGGAWDVEYQASHRLAHYEQTLMVMGDILGIETGWVGETLTKGLTKTLTEADWCLEGLRAYADAVTHKGGPDRFGTREIAHWAQGDDDYMDNRVLTNSRSLGKYMNNHKRQIEVACGIKDMGSYANRRIYGLVKTSK